LLILKWARAKVVEGRKTINILMVEDSAIDAFLTREILSDSQNNVYKISTVTDGFAALSFLQGINGYEQSSQPDLIILDLNLPRMRGFDFLAVIKKVPELKIIPVCILTTSDSIEDIEKAQELGVDCYLIKPLDLEKFETTFFGSNAD
jgi:chemotaxis family two-component system response regulator Rcp1